MQGLEEANNVFTGLVVYGGIVVAAFWLAIIFWTYRDMRARSRDPMAQILVAIMVAILTLPGLLIYVLLRPRETLAEAYERSLEEEALLQEIENKPTCPGCAQRVQNNWQVCPYCHTTLKKACISCGQKLELAWNLCPYCATPQPNTTNEPVSEYNPYQISTPTSSRRRNRRSTNSESIEPTLQQSNSLEFIDGEDYN